MDGRGRAIAGTAAVAWLLATTRWGSQIGSAPLFITDVLIALALVRLCLREPATTRKPGRSGPTMLLGLFVAYVVARMFAAAFEPNPLVDWARDGVPYLYAALAFLSAAAWNRASEADRQRTVRVLWAALLVHLGWVVVVVFAELTDLPQPPGFGLPIFSLRPDVDTAVIAVTAAVALRRWLHRDHRILNALVVALALGTSQMATSRAGLLSVLAVLALCFFFHYVGGGSRRRTNMVLAVPLVVIALAVVLPMTVPGQRLLASVAPTDDVSNFEVQAQGTAEARSRAWDALIYWVQEDGSRELFGSGFGNNFMSDSQASVALLGNAEQTDVRSPHNWFIGTYARLGLVGVVFAVLVVLQLLLILVMSRRRFAEDELLFLGATVVVAFLPVATLGVVLESPFGAVPFWWCAGLLYAARRRHSMGEIPASPAASATPQPAR